MKITAIKKHPRLDRLRLFVDGGGEPRAELAADLVMGAGLGVGSEIGEGELERLVREDQAFRARDAALSLLSHRARSRAELRRRLERKEFTPATIEQTVAWLDERGYLDDRAFAESFVRDRLKLRPRGRIGLLQELRRKGVDPATAEAAIDGVMDSEEVDEVALARDAAALWGRRNATALRQAGGSREHRLRVRRRLYGHLARRGFRPDAIREAIAASLPD